MHRQGLTTVVLQFRHAIVPTQAPNHSRTHTAGGAIWWYYYTCHPTLHASVNPMYHVCVQTPDHLKTPTAEEAFNPNGLSQRTIRLLKDAFPDVEVRYILCYNLLAVVVT